MTVSTLQCIRDAVFRKKEVELFLGLPRESTKVLAKRIPMTTSYIYNQVRLFRDRGLINFEKVGRSNRITYTEKGLKIALLLEGIIDCAENGKCK